MHGNPAIQISHLDHLVLTVRDMQAAIDFYTRVLGMTDVVFGGGRHALQFGSQKINLHQAGAEFDPKAQNPTPGAADLCFITPTPLAEFIAHVEACGVTVELGPVERTGATGPLLSFYLRDPDGNLIELSNPIDQR